MLEKLISVIIPVYNVEEYLEECMESLANQTYANLELLFVDDGSTDNSLSILKNYRERNPNINIKIFEKNNGGQSSARNLGIQKASGEYLAFVDSDDYVTETYFEDLLNCIEKYQIKIAMSKMTKTEAELRTIREVEILKGSFLELVEKLYSIDYPSVSPCAKIYHKSLFKNVKFVNGIIYEDGIFFYEIIDKIDTIGLVDSVNYFYRTNENSTTTKKINKKSFDALRQNEILESFFLEKHPEALSHFYKKALNLNDYIAVKCIQDSGDLSQKLINEIYIANKKYSKKIYPRRFIYIWKWSYCSFLYIMSKIYSTKNVGSVTNIKKIINKLVR